MNIHFSTSCGIFPNLLFFHLYVMFSNGLQHTSRPMLAD